MKIGAKTEVMPPHSENGKISHDDVAFAAYCLWEQEGRPIGRDLGHWFRAEKLLREAYKGASVPEHSHSQP